MPKSEPTRSRNPNGTRKSFSAEAPNRSKPAMYWENVPSDDLAELVQKLCDNGFGLVLGRTSDGGALSITVLDGEQRIREYSASVDALRAFSAWCDTALGN